MSNKYYFSHPYVSASTLKKFAGPDHLYSQRQSLHKLQTPHKPTDAMSTGTLFHEAMEKGWIETRACPYSEFRTKEAKEWKENHAGPIIKQKMIDTAKMMMESVKLMAPDIWSLARAENSYPEKEVYNHDLKLKCKQDLFDANTGIVWDWKLAYDVTPAGIRKACDRLHYDLQQYQYLKADTDATSFNFLFVQSEPPFEVVIVPGASILERGMMKWGIAYERYKRRMDDVLEAKVVDPSWGPTTEPDEDVEL